MLYEILAIVAGLALLVWSADRFIDGAAATARHFGMSPLLIGMVIVGFGTSAPEMVVSVMSALDGSPGIALGNAYGSNIANIALILGVTVLISPMLVRPQIVKVEMPILLAATALSVALLWDGALSVTDGAILLISLAVYMVWTVLKNPKGVDNLVEDVAEEGAPSGLGRGLMWLVLGLVILVLSSRLLVWGAVAVAQDLGVSDLVIGLTVVAVGTSLPELASSVMAARKGEHDIALGNVVGSNFFNTLAVVGLAGVISPITVAPEILQRDLPVVSALTVLLLIFCLNKRGAGKIGRFKGLMLVGVYVAYTVYLISTSFGGS